jgi:phospholipid/cholesterol/gamma-HCH transport system permease protein
VTHSPKNRPPRAVWRLGAQSGYCLEIGGQPGGDVVLTLSGRLDLAGLASLTAEMERLWEVQRPKTLRLDLAGVDYLDSAGGLALAACGREAARRGVPLTFVNLSPAAQGIKELIDRTELDRPPLIPAQRRQSLVERAGEIGLAVKDDAYQVVSFLGDFLGACVRAARHPRLLRWGEVLIYMEKVGVDGLGIVALISFLLGLIMAFMSSLQLQPFGANIYVANLVAVAMVKELGPIMTAILVAGRSGSAFAAEIGTMKVNEEVDALSVMGYDPLVFLALPKVLAAVLTVPLLTLFADLVAILGGLTVGVVGMGFTVQAYVQQTLKTLYAADILTGCLKAAVFAVLIAGIGCQRGFKVRGGAESVGTETTSAVVSAMFLIIVADSIFAIVLHYTT